MALSRNVLIYSWLSTLTFPYTPQPTLHPVSTPLSSLSLIGFTKNVRSALFFNKYPYFLLIDILIITTI